MTGVIMIILSGFEWGISRMPDVTWSIDTGVFAYFFSILKMVCYVLPMGTVGQIFSIFCALQVLRIVVATLKTFWDVLPFA